MERYVDTFSNVYEAVPDGKVFRISYDNTINSLRLIYRDLNAFDEIRDAFSVKNDSAFFLERYGYKAEQKLYAINKFGFFSPGLIFEILALIKNVYGGLHCIAVSEKCRAYIADYLTPLKGKIPTNFNIANCADDTGRNQQLLDIRQKKIDEGIPETEIKEQAFEYRYYQYDSLQALFTNGYGRGLIEVPTAGGKSFVISNFIWNYWKHFDKNAKTLILVPSTQLVAQFYSDLIDYGIPEQLIARFTGSLSAKEKKNNDINSAKIIISNRQYVFKNEKLLPKIDVLIADEVHTCNASSTQKFIENLSAKIKIGCSGTLPRTQYDKWKLIGMFGQIVHTETIVDLQKQGFISKLDITCLKIRDKHVDENSNLLFSLNTIHKFDAEAVQAGESDIMFNDAYNDEKEYFTKYYKELYKPVFEYIQQLNSNTLMLFDRIEIGKNLFEYATELYKDKNVFYIDGSIDVHTREDIRAKFEQSDGNLLIAQNAVMSTGVNIKRLTNLVFLTSSKAFARTIQSIGRTLRLHSSKQKAHLIDLSWNTKYSQKHLNERLRIYKQMYNKKPDNIINIEI